MASPTLMTFFKYMISVELNPRDGGKKMIEDTSETEYCPDAWKVAITIS